MRFKLEFELSKEELVKDYRRCFLSIIKNALSKYADGELMDKFYVDTIGKDYTWTVILNKPQFEKDRILLDGNNIKMIISADDKNQSGYFLFSAFLKLKNMDLPLPKGNAIKLKNIEMLPTACITENCALFKIAAGSPVVVREHNKETNKDRYFSVADEDYNEELTKALIRQSIDAGFGEKSTQTVMARVARGKKVIVKHYDSYLDATTGFLEISGPAIILQHFYQNGIASRRSAGFGMLDFIEQTTI